MTDGAAPPASGGDPPPWLVSSPRFTHRRHLGAGASGPVVEAFDATRAEPVAVKAIAPPAGPRERAALEAHFRALAALDHPSLVAPYELVDEGAALLLTMPVVPGRPLGALLLEQQGAASTHLLFGQPVLDPAAAREAAARPRPSPAVRRALADAAAGLGALHRAGLCHGDVRPDNAIVLPDGRARLIDFGPWAPGDAGAWRERPPAYLAPEQEPDAPPAPAADWYAFGVVLFEALTGLLPFDGSALDVTLRKTTLPPPRPSFLARNVDPDLDALAWALLARDPRDRPPAADVLARLRPRP